MLRGLGFVTEVYQGYYAGKASCSSKNPESLPELNIFHQIIFRNGIFR